MKVALACDHGAYKEKEELKTYLIEEGYEMIDFGTFSTESCNYPEFAFKAAEAVKDKKADRGILLCTSGEGVSIAANKVKGIICGIGYNDDVSHLIVEHNHANMISFGAKFMSIDDIKRRSDIFLNSVQLDGRHQVRVDMIKEYEEK